LRRTRFTGSLGGFDQFFMVAFTAFAFFRRGSELSIHGFEMGFAFAEGLFVGA
jgi:hypothetical protein